MLVFLYDGSFQGFLTALYEAFYHQEPPAKIVKEKDFQESLFASTYQVKTDKEKADKVYTAIKEKISTRSLRRVYYAYLSEAENIETDIFKYLQQGFKIGKRIDKALKEDYFLRVEKWSRRVKREKYRLLGLLRFRELEEGIFYAPIEPDFNILSFLASHFARRLADQSWIIHDKKREKAAIYNQEEWVITDVHKNLAVIYSGEEEKYQKLWQEFFNAIAIENRRNPWLQSQMMPKKYWKYLIEKN